MSLEIFSNLNNSMILRYELYLKQERMVTLLFLIFSFSHQFFFPFCWLSGFLPPSMRTEHLHQKQMRISWIGRVVRAAFRRNYDCLIWEQHGKNQSYSPPRLEQGCLQHQPVLHPLVPAGNVAMPVSASPGNPQPWHAEHSVLVDKEKTSVITEQNKALLSGTFWTRPIPQPL